jgi:hypothetical protein
VFFAASAATLASACKEARPASAWVISAFFEATASAAA